ncbi:MAG: antA/AntB antirepressor family protein [Prevotellaceae bacterium]|jgi:phage anti-repressor protein|nr:antA/AntB antirepressor family protein [Prevotellaceae bacterium]
METKNHELIPISEHNGRKSVSARMLHAFLESKKDFSDWIKHRIQKYGLVENQDYVSLPQKVERGIGGTIRIEYALSISAAKELAMVEGNAKGKQARQYFIACEQKLKEVSKPLSPAEQLLQQAQLMVEQERRIEHVESKLHVLEARISTRPNYFTIVGYATLHRISVNLKQASILGRRASELCKARDIETDRIPDPRFGEVRMYPADVLDEVFEQSLTVKRSVAKLITHNS